MTGYPAQDRLERTGWPAGREAAAYRCPNCGGGLAGEEQVYIRDDGQVLGCGVCVLSAYADEALGGGSQ